MEYIEVDNKIEVSNISADSVKIELANRDEDAISVINRQYEERLSKIHEKYDSVLEKVNKLNQGFTLEYDGKDFYLIYPQCYCSCVKRIGETLPKEWCYCTLGYTKRMFQYIFDKEVQVELLSSIKMGDDNCKIRISK